MGDSPNPFRSAGVLSPSPQVVGVDAYNLTHYVIIEIRFDRPMRTADTPLPGSTQVRKGSTTWEPSSPLWIQPTTLDTYIEDKPFPTSPATWWYDGRDYGINSAVGSPLDRTWGYPITFPAFLSMSPGTIEYARTRGLLTPQEMDLLELQVEP